MTAVTCNGMRGIGLAAAALAVLTSGCGSSSTPPAVASLASPTPSTSASATSSNDVLAYPRCMRAHGLPDFPDPRPGVPLDVRQFDPRSTTFKAADHACLSTRPKQQGGPPAKDTLLAFARCMRAHGMPDFPDPQADGDLIISGKSGIDLDPDSPTLKAAQTACKKYAPGGGAAPAGAVGLGG